MLFLVLFSSLSCCFLFRRFLILLSVLLAVTFAAPAVWKVNQRSKTTFYLRITQDCTKPGAIGKVSDLVITPNPPAPNSVSFFALYNSFLESNMRLDGYSLSNPLRPWILLELEHCCKTLLEVSLPASSRPVVLPSWIKKVPIYLFVYSYLFICFFIYSFLCFLIYLYHL